MTGERRGGPGRLRPEARRRASGSCGGHRDRRGNGTPESIDRPVRSRQPVPLLLRRPDLAPAALGAGELVVRGEQRRIVGRLAPEIARDVAGDGLGADLFLGLASRLSSSALRHRCDLPSHLTTTFSGQARRDKP